VVAEPRLLGERYRMGEMLGYGGMAEVHAAHDNRLGRDVAIKTLRADLARDPGFQSRFRREAQSAASLNHPSIVAVYDTGEEVRGDQRVPYIVMEYVEGRTLRDVLNDERRLPWRRALEITSKTCQALDYSHRQGIVHRDIKPANVMLTPDGDVKVMDFGIARAITSATATMTQTASIMGTAQYLSPEQARGEPVDARSDVYSTGCLVYELVTGTPPFTGDSPVAVAYQHVREDPTPPSHVVTGLPAAVDAIILKAMAKNPANRYQSTAEMRLDCERALAGAPVAATPLLDAQTVAVGSVPVDPGTTVRLRPPAYEEPPRRRILGYVLLALACLAVLLGAAYATRYFTSSGQRVAVPALTGKTVPQAKAALTSLGLVLHEAPPRTSSTTKAGLIIGQTPTADTRVKKDSTVDVTVSSGPAMVTVPKVVGTPLDVATATLKARGLAVGSVLPSTSSKPANTVLTQNPAQGGTVASGTKVNLTVASGTARVPNLVGKTEKAALALLRKAGFLYNVSTIPDARHRTGTVVTQDPPAGSTLQTASTVTLTVASAPPTPSTSPTPSQSPTSAPTPTDSPSPTPSAPSASPTASPTASATASPTSS